MDGLTIAQKKCNSMQQHCQLSRARSLITTHGPSTCKSRTRSSQFNSKKLLVASTTPITAWHALLSPPTPTTQTIKADLTGSHTPLPLNWEAFKQEPTTFMRTKRLTWLTATTVVSTVGRSSMSLKLYSRPSSSSQRQLSSMTTRLIRVLLTTGALQKTTGLSMETKSISTECKNWLMEPYSGTTCRLELWMAQLDWLQVLPWLQSSSQCSDLYRDRSSLATWIMPLYNFESLKESETSYT